MIAHIPIRARKVSRDEADYHGARKRLAFLGIKIHPAHGGEISGIEGSVRAMMGALFLENLAHKVRRGLAGVVRSGRHAGGRSYGYLLMPREARRHSDCR